MLSIASWRSGAAKEQEPEAVEQVVRRAAPKPEGPAPSVTPPATPAVDGDHRGAPRQPCVRRSIDQRPHALALRRGGDARQYFDDRSSGRMRSASQDWQLRQSVFRGSARSATG